MSVFDWIKKGVNKVKETIFGDPDENGISYKPSRNLSFSYDEEDVEEGQITKKYLQNRVDDLQDEIIIGHKYEVVAKADTSDYKINMFNSDFKVLMYPIYIPCDEIRSFFKRKISDSYNWLIAETAYLKLVQYISIYVDNYFCDEYDIDDRDDFADELVETDWHPAVAKFAGELLEKLFAKLIDELSDNDLDSYDDHDDIIDLIDCAYNETMLDDFEYDFDEFFTNYESDNEDYVDDTYVYEPDNEIDDAFGFFNLKKGSSYDEFKSRYREFAKKYHPDHGTTKDEEMMMRTNKMKLILENYFKGD